MSGTTFRFIALVCACAIFCATVQAEEPPTERPSALVACERARQAIRTAEVCWSGSTSGSAFAPGVEFRRRSLLAGDDLIELDLGDESGVTGFTPDGEPVVRDTKQLFNDEMRVDYVIGDVFAYVIPEQYDFRPSFPDVRAFGLLPIQTRAHRDLADTFWTYPPDDTSARTYEQKRSGELYDVTMRLESGAAVRWLIDPQRDYNVVRAELYEGGELRRYSVSQLKKYGQTWFPESVEFYVGGRNEPVVRRRVQQARFNEPDLPQHLTIEQLDLEPGISLNFVDPETRAGYAKVWTGSEVVEWDEWQAMVNAGTAEPGPTVKAFMEEMRPQIEAHYRAQAADEARSSGRPEAKRRPAAEHAAPAPAAAGVSREQQVRTATSKPVAEHPWEKYTREFIEKYKLNDEQSQQAWAICRECHAAADAHLARCREKLSDIDRRIDELRKSQEREIAKRLLALEEERHKLLQPVDDIFEKQLKPRLDKLPTRAQRKAVDAGAGQTTRPTDSKRKSGG